MLWKGFLLVRRPKPTANHFAQQNPSQLLTAAQAQQVAGGCSHPQGCASLNEGVAVVTLRQAPVTDFTDQEIGWPMPFSRSQ